MWIFVLFIIGLFAKIQMVALPLSFIAVDYWYNKEMNFKVIIQKWPYFLGSLIFGLLGIYMLQGQGLWKPILTSTYSRDYLLELIVYLYIL